MRILDNHYYYDADPDTAATYDMRGRLANTLTRRVDPTFNQLGLMTSFGYGIAEFPAEFAEFRYQHGLMNRIRLSNRILEGSSENLEIRGHS